MSNPNLSIFSDHDNLGLLSVSSSQLFQYKTLHIHSICAINKKAISQSLYSFFSTKASKQIQFISCSLQVFQTRNMYSRSKQYIFSQIRFNQSAILSLYSISAGVISVKSNTLPSNTHPSSKK